MGDFQLNPLVYKNHNFEKITFFINQQEYTVEGDHSPWIIPPSVVEPINTHKNTDIVDVYYNYIE